jgi:hypothetical protein
METLAIFWGYVSSAHGRSIHDIDVARNANASKKGVEDASTVWFNLFAVFTYTMQCLPQLLGCTVAIEMTRDHHKELPDAGTLPVKVEVFHRRSK